MGLANGITVRLDEETRAWLERLADQSGIKSSALIRHALQDYLDRVEKTGRLEILVGSAPKPRKTA